MQSFGDMERMASNVFSAYASVATSIMLYRSYKILRCFRFQSISQLFFHSIVNRNHDGYGREEWHGAQSNLCSCRGLSPHENQPKY